MELKIKDNNKIKREEGPTRNQSWGILKYLSAEIFTETQRLIRVRWRMNVEANDTCQRHHRSKIGVWQMPLFKFLYHGDLKENFKSSGRRDLNIKYTNFSQLKCREYHAYEYNHMNACNVTTYAKTVNIYWLGNKTDKYHLGGTNCLLPLLG